LNLRCHASVLKCYVDYLLSVSSTIEKVYGVSLKCRHYMPG